MAPSFEYTGTLNFVGYYWVADHELFIMEFRDDRRRVWRVKVTPDAVVGGIGAYDNPMDAVRVVATLGTVPGDPDDGWGDEDELLDAVLNFGTPLDFMIFIEEIGLLGESERIIADRPGPDDPDDADAPDWEDDDIPF